MELRKNKAASDPQLPMDRRSPHELHHSRRALLSVSGETFDRRRSPTYGSVNDDTPCCVAGEHFLTSSRQDFISRSLSMDSTVNVDFTDVNGEGQALLTNISLRRCNSTFLRPYSLLLNLIGWRPWGNDRLYRQFLCLEVLNKIYPLLVVTLIIYSYVFQALICHGKYNIVEDTKPTPTETTLQPELTTSLPHKNCTVFAIVWNCSHFNIVWEKKSAVDLEMNVIETKRRNAECDHKIQTYIIPSIMHFLAFAYGFIHFRIQDCEHLYSLMEKVFLQAQHIPGLQNLLVRNTRLYFIGAALWISFQMGIEVLYNFAFTQKLWLGDESIPFTSLHPNLYYGLLALKFVGTLLVNFVYVAVIINYCTQCEMVVMYIRALCLGLHEKSMEIKKAMHEILGVREFISVLNGTMGKMTSFCIVNFAELTIIGTALLVLNEIYDIEIQCYRILFPLIWLTFLIFPLVQAGRVTRTGSKLRQISFEMRVFGYQASPQLELDSFVLFVSGATLRAKLFGVTIRPATVIVTLGASVFILLTLMLFNVFSLSGIKEFL